MVAKSGKQMVIVDHPEIRELSDRERAPAIERFLEVAERIRERNADKDRDERPAFITKVVEEVRQEHYERTQREAAKRH